MVSLLLALVSMTFASNEVGFSKGNEFREDSVHGDLLVYCSTSQGSTSARVRCNGTQLSPVDHDYFMGPEGIDADKVQLSTIQTNGREISKSKKYTNGKSTQAFNLYISTLLQRPLLSFGANQISYKLFKNDAVVADGEFTANVTRGETLRCQPYTHFSNTRSDCDAPYALCSYYFNVARCQ